MVVFLVATSLILSAAVVPNLLTQGRREREEEMVWRGEQYERAIGLYFQKFGRYPTKIDDLTKQTNGVRFLRQAYTDPMNKEDGTWRFIYVGPNGQLIGSVNGQSLLQGLLGGSAPPTGLFPGAGAQAPPPPGSLAGNAAAAGQTGQQVGQQPDQQPGQEPGQQPGLSPGQPPGQQTGSPMGLDSSQPQPLTGAVIGGNIIGVGSKIKQPSFLVYQGGETYQQWEFIWNPTQQVGLPGQAAPVNPVAMPAPGQLQQQNQQTPGMQPQLSPGATTPTNPPPGM